MTGFWKEWLKAVIVPTTDGRILRVPSKLAEGWYVAAIRKIRGQFMR